MSVSTITIAAVLSATGPLPAGDVVILPDPVELAPASSRQPLEAAQQPVVSAPEPSDPAAVDPAPASTSLPPETAEPPVVTSEKLPGAAGQAIAPDVPLHGKADDMQPVAGRASDKNGNKEIVVQGEAGLPPGDPLANVNAQTFEVVQAVDKALVEPVAHGYMAVVPKPVRDGLHNVVTNLDEPITFLSFILQFKFGKALATLGRFAINSTIGIGGLIDVAKRKPFNQPHLTNSLGHTLAFYGVRPGPFLYLPIIGSTTLRDLIGQLAAIPILPLAIGKPFNDPAYVMPKALLTGIDQRVQDDPRIQEIRAESSNPYAVYRSYYLRKRQAEVDVLKGKRENADVPVFEDEPLDDEDDAAAPVNTPSQPDAMPSAEPTNAAPQPDDLPAAAVPHIFVDDGAILAQ